MHNQLVDLLDGTRLEAKVNFGTLYHLQKCGAMGLMKRIDKKNIKKQKPTDEWHAGVICLQMPCR